MPEYPDGEGSSTVEQYRMFFNDFIEHIPYFRLYLFHHALSALDVMSDIIFHQFLHDKRLKELQSHFLRQAALIEFEFRTYDDY